MRPVVAVAPQGSATCSPTASIRDEPASSAQRWPGSLGSSRPATARTPEVPGLLPYPLAGSGRTPLPAGLPCAPHVGRWRSTASVRLHSRASPRTRGSSSVFINLAVPQVPRLLRRRSWARVWLAQRRLPRRQQSRSGTAGLFWPSGRGPSQRWRARGETHDTTTS